MNGPQPITLGTLQGHGKNLPPMTVGELLSEIDPGPKIFEPDGINDMQAEYDRPEAQPGIPRIRGSPEGVLFGRIGYIVVDFETGDVWQKTTTLEVATGWVQLYPTASAGVALTIGNGPPAPGSQPSGTFYWDETDKLLYVFDADGPNIH